MVPELETKPITKIVQQLINPNQSKVPEKPVLNIDGLPNSENIKKV